MANDSLFRKEALSANGTRHLGGIRIDAPPGTGLVCLSILGLVLVAMLYIGNAHYARALPVTGVIDNHHARQIIAVDFGELVELDVQEGDSVTQGQLLGKVSNTRFNGNRKTSAALKAELAKQKQQWLALHEITIKSSELETRQLTNRLKTLRSQHQLAGKDVKLQLAKVRHLDNHLKKTSRLRKKGHLSGLDWLNLSTALITERQALNRERGNQMILKQKQADTESELLKVKAGRNKRLTEIALKLSQLRRTELDQDRSSYQFLIAPMNGHVSRLGSNKADSVVPGQTIMYIAEEHPMLTGTLVIPSAAAGFVSEGQQMKLEIDAFPVERHGRVSARILQISNHTIDDDKHPGPAYLARVAIDSAPLRNMGTGVFLPGMSFRTHINIDRKSIFDWVFEPILDFLNETAEP